MSIILKYHVFGIWGNCMFNSNIMMEPAIFRCDRMSFLFAEQDVAPFRVNAGARLFCPARRSLRG